MKRIFLIVLSLITISAHSVLAFCPFDSKPYITPTTSPQNSVCISWNTDTPESTIVAYGVTLALEDTLRLDSVRSYHHAALTDLLSETRYYYRVVPDGERYQFCTFPQQSNTLSFVAFGDTRSDSVAHQSVINRMAAFSFDFIMHTGDLVNDGDRTIDWRIFFNIEDTVLPYNRFLPVIGNHEAPFWPYDTLFFLPDSEDYYSVNHGNTHYTMLNTETDLYGAQRDWLTADLQIASSDTSIDWIFVSLHRPPYSSGNHGSQLDVREAWCRLFEEYGVDIVFAGHDHSYERTDSINGVIYIVTGGGGAPLRDVGTSSWTMYSEKTYHFCHVQITDRTLLLRAIKPDGTVFDSLIVDKSTRTDEHTQRAGNAMVVSPNPFTEEVTIQYSLTTPQRVCARVYDRAGRYVNTLVNGVQQPGTHTAVWYGEDTRGQAVNAGSYYVILVIDGLVTRKKVVRIVK
ncbi:hypothetical protein AMJ87_05845 [candidate division WOR_3 bacterium SM23_60]|uniref:Fibronectin type-III domain-containing protein n=1 Tax=candidate division WOR_3 bacterium SM23_60 TaxID=1703780 RepID=A0A0S8GI83_UNCW3|nr:MAG: hypothetical protein AMJ87_05845 [candidate division WOR_3 bacterium SM23_60]